jgi:hypothetical protein
MKLSPLVSMLLAIVLFLNAPAALAFETDQYNLPPEPLFDIGDEVTAHVRENIQTALDKLNADIAVRLSCLDKTAAKGTKCGSEITEKKALDFLRSNDAAAEAVYKQLGSGNLFITVTGKWFKKHKFSHEPALYKVGFTDSIFILMPIDYATISPTIRMYGTEFGTDKVEHFFQQGYKYYKLYNDAAAKGKTAKEAEKKAVDWGKRTERTYFGLLVSGVYSNADLYANYAGMRFYQGLGSPIQIGSTTRPSTLVLEAGKWQINEAANINETLLKPFVTDHMNEAFNPSGYSFILYPTVKRVVKNQCPAWQKAYPQLTREIATKRSTDLELWNGEDYGFAKKGHSVAIASCFDDKLVTQ